VVEPRLELPQEPTLAPLPLELPPPEVPIPAIPVDLPPDAVTNHLPEPAPLDVHAEAKEGEPIEDVKLEVVESGFKRRRKRRRRPSWGRLRSEMDYWISPTLILLLLFAPGGLLLVGIAFVIHPGAGIGSLFMVGGGLWLMLVAAEDGLITALLVMFVPFYVLYYVFLNFERTAIPFLLQCVGVIIFVVSLVMAGMRAVEQQVSLPPQLVPRTGSATFLLR
jgi:hypothetical protein